EFVCNAVLKHPWTSRHDVLTDLVTKIRRFRDERDWKRFHDPKNLAIAISIEAARSSTGDGWRKTPQASRQIFRGRAAAFTVQRARCFWFGMLRPTSRLLSPQSRTIRRGRNRQRIPGIMLDNRQETLPERHHARPVVKLGRQRVVGSVLHRCEIDDIVRSDRRSRRRQLSKRNISN